MRLWRVTLLAISLALSFLLLGLLTVTSPQAQDATVDPALTETGLPFDDMIITDEAADDLSLTDEVFATTEPTADAIEMTEAIETTPDPVPTQTIATTDLQTYTVVRGDTLRVIAQRYQTTIDALVRENGIVNPDIIYIGQILRIPTGETVAPSTLEAPVPTATLVITPSTSEPRTTTSTGSYTIRQGDTLAKIALQFDTTVEALRTLNQIENPNLIYAGQTLMVSGSVDRAADADRDAGTGTSGTTADSPSADTPLVQAGASFDYGIYLYARGQDTSQVITQAQQLGVNWVRLDVKWRDIESVQGQPSFAALDPLIQGFDQAGFNILLTISAAPSWSRSSQSEDGPPDDPAVFASFMTALSTHYAGVIDAYQIWNEPNLRREWNSARYPISAQFYVDLLRPAYDSVKAVDPNALIITAGLAPTGFNDGVNAISDRAYLKALYESDVMNVSDAMGASVGGWANPPDATCCTPPEGISTHFEDRSFYFHDTLTDYQDIMQDYSDTRPLWITKFGWGTSEDTTPPTENTVYFTYTDLEEQAEYVVRAFELGAETRNIGPMFLNNLDGCTGTSVWPERCAYSLTAPDGSARPVFDAVAGMDKSNAAGANP